MSRAIVIFFAPSARARRFFSNGAERWVTFRPNGVQCKKDFKEDGWRSQYVHLASQLLYMHKLTIQYLISILSIGIPNAPRVQIDQDRTGVSC